MSSLQTAHSPSNSAQSHVFNVMGNGNLILDIQHQPSGKGGLYRVKSCCLRDTSSYFDRLLHPEKFQEGAIVALVQRDLENQCGNDFGSILLGDLPHIKISDVGQISELDLFEKVLIGFLKILHGLRIDSYRESTSYFAGIAILADRFEALEAVGRHVDVREYMQSLGTGSKSFSRIKSEERLRQRLLIGMLLDYPDWIDAASKCLIIGTYKPRSGLRGKSFKAADAMWWNLPGIMEDELIYRRECILDTINSIQLHYLRLYTSKARQCKLGYDSSAQCDSFQLGEMIRFFTRIGAIRFQGLICDDSEPAESYDGDIQQLLDNLRQCPSYQIDQNHSHCGLRVRLLPALEYVQRWVDQDARICGISWRSNKESYAWTNFERVSKWKFSKLPDFARTKESIMSSKTSCDAIHRESRELFTAMERDWTPS